MEKKRVSTPKNMNLRSYKVEEEAQLLPWLLNHLGGSRSKVKAILQGKGVMVDGRVITQFNFQLRRGMTVEISQSKRQETLNNKFVRLVYEDSSLVVIEKHPGILSMAAGHSTLNVKSLLDDYFQRTKQPCHAHVVHRLDKDTSGLMIYAKSKQVALALEADWHQTVYDRRYLAVLSGKMEKREGTIANWLKDNKAYVTFSSPVDNGGKYAVTHFFTLKSNDQYSLVEFKLETGRKNQIRVHSADMGHPVCGDVKYGNGDDPLGRLCLHAFLLCFTHPVTHQALEFETPAPPPFLSLFP